MLSTVALVTVLSTPMSYLTTPVRDTVALKAGEQFASATGVHIPNMGETVPPKICG